MKLLSEVFKSEKKTKKQQQQNKNKQKTQKNPNKPASWSLILTWLVGFKPARDRILLLTNQIYHS
jgi:membrane protein YqaA with SNARE-associated domain